MANRTVLQIIMIAAALFIVFAVIKPKLDAIKIVQDQSVEYKNAADKASLYNQELSNLIGQKDNISPQQHEALERYLPYEVDEVAVLADVKAIADMSGLVLVGAARSDESEEQVRGDNDLEEDVDTPKTVAVDFKVTAEGYYPAFKDFLSMLQYNQYQLEIASLAVVPQMEGGVATKDDEVVVGAEPIFNYEFVLRAYSFSN